MPRVSYVFILQTYNAADVLVAPVTRAYKFTGGAAVTNLGNGKVEVDVSGAAASSWLLAGNTGAGFVHGTNSADDWEFISSGISRGGFKFSGEFFLKTHAAFTNSEFLQKTGAVSTTDATPTTIFAVATPDTMNWFVTCRIQARRDDGTERAAFERKVMFFREGGGATLGTKVHTIFTDKTHSAYDVNFSVSGNNLLVKVTGDTGHNVFWSGLIEFQGIKDAV